MKIAIVGKSKTRLLAPYDDPQWCIWALPWVCEGDVYFDPHTPEHSLSIFGRVYHDKLSKIKEPIYMQAHYSGFPESVALPLDSLINEFGDYFNSTADYMLAMAILKNPEQIGVYGFDMNESYTYQRPSFEYLLGIARGRGIPLIFPDTCPLLKYPRNRNRYGYG